MTQGAHWPNASIIPNYIFNVVKRNDDGKIQSCRMTGNFKINLRKGRGGINMCSAINLCLNIIYDYYIKQILTSSECVQLVSYDIRSDILVIQWCDRLDS